MTAKDKWEKDKIRLANMFKTPWVKLVIVVWELSFLKILGKDKVLEQIYNIVDSIQNRKEKEILWI